MGSRLKGRRPKPKPSYRVGKLIVYAVLAVAVIAGLWILYLSRETVLDARGNPQTGLPTEGEPPP